MAWTVLIVDDHSAFRGFARRLLEADGFTIAEQLAEHAPKPIVVLTSSREEIEFGGRIARSPAVGFIHKDDLSGAALAALAAKER